MEQSLDYSVQMLLNSDLRVGQETIEHCRGMILQSAYAAQFVRSAKLVEIVTQNHRHEVGLNNALGLRGR
jgi:hypothetical protein